MPLTVKSKQGSYPVYIHSGNFLEHFNKLLKRHPQSQFAVITDNNIYSHHQKSIVTKIKQSRVHLLTINAGEKNKSIHSKMKLEKELFNLGFDRSSILIAWGGGVIGDLVGYLAATYMRGITYYAFPTSVIAMVDSSVGGKTGIDTPYGKNLIGSIYPPKGVFIDIALLSSLPQREFINGSAEIAKYHFIKSQRIGELIRSSSQGLQSKKDSLMIKLIEESLKVKIEVVNQDENENGLRRVLNFGHTFGHALEHMSHYRISHGFAIAIGMGVEAFWALRKKSISPQHFKSILSLLALIKLPTAIPPAYNTISAHKELYQLCLRDKKSQNKNIYYVCVKNGGIWKVKSNRGQYRESISQKEFMDSLKLYNQHISKI